MYISLEEETRSIDNATFSVLLNPKSFALTDDESFDVRMRLASYLQRCVAKVLCRSEITAVAIVYAHWKHGHEQIRGRLRDILTVNTFELTTNIIISLVISPRERTLREAREKKHVVDDNFLRSRKDNRLKSTYSNIIERHQVPKCAYQKITLPSVNVNGLGIAEL